jgi:group I intron endonuclease
MITRVTINKIEKFLGFTPCKIYENLHLLDIQLLIKTQNKHKSGIYMLYNLINDKVYIGSACSNKINVKFRNHCINGTESKVTKKAIFTHGLQNFLFIILEYYPGFIMKENLSKNHLQLLGRETYFIQKLIPAYNIINKVSHNFDCKHAEVTKDTMKINYFSEHKVISKDGNIDKSLSNYTKILLIQMVKVRNSNLELKKKLSILARKAVILFQIDNTIHSKYPSIRNMAKTFNCSHKTINKCIKNNKIFRDIGFIKIDRNS